MGPDTTFLLPLLGFGTVSLLVLSLLGAKDRRTEQLAAHLERFTVTAQAAPPQSHTEDLRRAKRRFSTNATLDGFLGKQGFAEQMDRELAGASVPLRVGEYLLLRWACALAAAAAVMSYYGNVLFAVPAGMVGFFLPVGYVIYRRRRRLGLLNEQLVDALGLIAGGLRSGYSFLQGIEGVVRDLPSPISDEFRVVLEDLRIGVSVEESLAGLAKRVPTEDVDMLVTCMLVQRSSGGNLAEILENLAHTVRERIRIRREVNTLTAQERMSSYVVGALPVAAFIFLSVTSPDYLDRLFGEPIGQALLVAAIVMELIGFVIMRKIMDIGL